MYINIFHIIAAFYLISNKAFIACMKNVNSCKNIFVGESGFIDVLVLAINCILCLF